MSLHLPVFKSAGAAVFAFVLVLLAHSCFGSVNLFVWSWVGVFVSVAGMIYTQLFEYLWHKVFMHVGVKFFEAVKKSHLRHHMIFEGDNFQSRKPEDLDQITTRWFIFPLLLFLLRKTSGEKFWFFQYILFMTAFSTYAISLWNPHPSFIITLLY